MASNFSDIRLNCLRRMMVPLVRFCLQGSNSIHDFVDVAKVVFVEVAEQELAKTTEKINVSRISIMTGVHRKDVTRIHKNKELPRRQQTALLSRVLGCWEQDPKWRTVSGTPKLLSHEGENSDFRRMVQSISVNIDPGTVLFELERIGAVSRTPKGLKLLVRAPTFHAQPEAGFEVLADDADTLFAAAQENLLARRSVPNLHLRTEYDNISRSDIPTVRKWLLVEGQKFHKRARDFLSRFDRDINPELMDEAGVSVVLSAFSYTSD